MTFVGAHNGKYSVCLFYHRLYCCPADVQAGTAMDGKHHGEKRGKRVSKAGSRVNRGHVLPGPD